MSTDRVRGTEFVVSTRRSAELALLIGAWLLGVFAWLSVDLATGHPTLGAWTSLVTAGALLLVAHFAVRTFAPYADPVILPSVAALNMLGLAMIHRLDIASNQRARATGSDLPTPDVYAQLTWLTIGLVLFVAVIMAVPDHRRLQRFTYTAGLSGFLLLFLPLVPGLGFTVYGARLWVRIAGFTFQPGELAKIALALFFAGFLVTRRHNLALVSHRVAGMGFPRIKDVGPVALIWLLCLAVLVLERDLGTSLLFYGLFLVMLYVASTRRYWVVLGTGFLAMGAYLAYQFFGHVRIRFNVWADPFANANTDGFQIVQSLYGLANGGLLGTGWGSGYPSLVPFAKTDFIAAALGEELGLVGLFAIFLLYAIIVERGARAAVATRDPFGSLLAIGLTTVLGLQAFIVLGGVTKLIPLTGLTTPFMSYGGSSLVANYIIVALLIRVSNAARKPEDSS